MCGIAGVISKESTDVVPFMKSMMMCMKNRGPDGAGLSIDKEIYQSNSVEKLSFDNTSSDMVLGHVRLAIVGGTCGSQPFKSCDNRLLLEHNGEIYNYKELRQELIKRHKFSSETDSEVVIHLLEDNYNRNNCTDLLKAIKDTMEQLDGVYVFAIKDQYTGNVYLVRDRLGIRQIYYGENKEIIGFASERKALWEIGLKEPTYSLLPGHCVIISKNISKPFKMLDPPVSQSQLYNTMEDSIDIYKKVLLNSIKKRTQDQKKIGVIFSGGIDSVLIAHIIKDFVPDVTCYTSGVKGSLDLEFVKSIGKELDLNLRTKELDYDYVEKHLPDIINIIETNNLTQVETAIPIFAAVQMAASDNQRILFSGQGADELFGGYPWYRNVVAKEGYDRLREHMTQDLLLLYKETLEREDKISMAFSIESRVPFLDPKVVRASTSIDMKLNINDDNDIFGKRVHRELALRLGIPHHIAYREKLAAQHGSGIHDFLKKIANKNYYTKDMVTKTYIDKLELREKLGSSDRYGYLYGSQELWKTDPTVQMYLDNIICSYNKKYLNQIICSYNKKK